MDDPMEDKNNWGWQATAKSIKERTTYLWKHNPIPFNVTFEVGPKGQKTIIGAHRDILAISSEVFHSMFYGPVAKPRDPNYPIVDDDIDPEAFRLMLKFAYTESIADGDGLKHCDGRLELLPTGVEMELVFQIMQAAGKYGIPALYLICRNYILDDIRKTFESSEGPAEHGILYAIYASNPDWNNKVIIDAVWREIHKHSKGVLRVPDQVLQTVDETLMVELLARTSLKSSEEIILYNVAIRWARLQQEGPRKDETLKNVMGKLEKVLRFSSMSQQEWLDGPVKDGLYTLDDLSNTVVFANGTTLRCLPDSPAVVSFEIFRARKIFRNQAKYGCKGLPGLLEIQTQTEDNPVLTKLVEKCVRKQMECNATDMTTQLSIDFEYAGNVLYCGGSDEASQIELNKEELDMLNNGGRIAAQMRLSLGDVSVGFILASEHDYPNDKLGKMYLVFGDDFRHDSLHVIHRTKLFYLGRLTYGQGYLDWWARNPTRRILYDVAYGMGPLDALSKTKKILERQKDH